VFGVAAVHMLSLCLSLI